MSKVQLIVVEYETKDTTIWKAGVLAYSHEEAIATIRKRLPTYDRLISIGAVRDIDCVSEEVYKEISKMFVPKTDTVAKPDQPDKNVKVPEPVTQEPDDGLVPCPFCDKSYKSERTLLNHIRKYHK